MHKFKSLWFGLSWFGFGVKERERERVEQLWITRIWNSYSSTKHNTAAGKKFLSFNLEVKNLFVEMEKKLSRTVSFYYNLVVCFFSTYIKQLSFQMHKTHLIIRVVSNTLSFQTSWIRIKSIWWWMQCNNFVEDEPKYDLYEMIIAVQHDKLPRISYLSCKTFVECKIHQNWKITKEICSTTNLSTQFALCTVLLFQWFLF